MEVLHYRCAGMDISKRDAKVCVRVPGARHNTFTKVITVTGAMTRDILELRNYLVAEEVSLVVMEATGDYWRPFYYLLDPGTERDPGQCPAREKSSRSQNGCFRRPVARRTRCPRTRQGLLRATRTNPPAS